VASSQGEAAPDHRGAVPAWTATGLRGGDRVRVTALHADGVPYRWWTAVVHEVTASRLLVRRPLGEPVYEPGRVRLPETSWQHVYWTDRFYNLTESYTAGGEPRQLAMDIASPAEWTGGGIAYRDYELDVVKVPGQPAEIYDEDEFAEAIVQYGYSPELQATCRAALAEALQVAESWTWLGSRGTPER
jgi:protein associated with RNAse G/E